MQKTITNEQIKCIKTIQRRNQTDEEYREVLQKRFKVTSCTQLTCAQAGKLIELYKKWGWMNSAVKRKMAQTKSTQRQSGNMTKMVSPAQKKKIGALADMVEWRVKDGLTRWVSKRFSIDRIRTAQQAWKIIEGLKQMLNRQLKTQYGQNWRELDYDDSRIKRYVESITS